MDAGVIVRSARRRAALSLRQLARRAATSHSTLSAYEAGEKVPSVATLARVVAAAGFTLDVELVPRPGGVDAGARGRELVEVLELAAQFPARHEPFRSAPRFGAV